MNKFLLSAFLILAFCAYYGSSEDLPPSSPQNMTDLAGTEIEQRAAKKSSHKRGAHKRHDKHLRAEETELATNRAAKAGVPSKEKQRKKEIKGFGEFLSYAMKELQNALVKLSKFDLFGALICDLNIAMAFLNYLGIM